MNILLISIFMNYFVSKKKWHIDVPPKSFQSDINISRQANIHPGTCKCTLSPVKFIEKLVKTGYLGWLECLIKNLA